MVSVPSSSLLPGWSLSYLIENKQNPRSAPAGVIGRLSKGFSWQQGQPITPACPAPETRSPLPLRAAPDFDWTDTSSSGPRGSWLADADRELLSLYFLSSASCSLRAESRRKPHIPSIQKRAVIAVPNEIPLRGCPRPRVVVVCVWVASEFIERESWQLGASPHLLLLLPPATNNLGVERSRGGRLTIGVLLRDPPASLPDIGASHPFMRPSLSGVSDSLCLTSHIPPRLCLPSSLCRDPGSWSFGLMPPSPPSVPGNHHRRLSLLSPHSLCFLADWPGPGPAELPCMRLLHVPASACTAKPLPCGPSVCAAERHVTPLCFFFFLPPRVLPTLAVSATNEPVANMLRRLVSLGHSASEDKRPMSPSPGDEQHPQEAKGAGGLAGVFKGLTGGGKPAKSPPVLQQPFAPIAASQAFAERSDVTPPPSALPGLSPEQVELFGRLKNSQQLSERVAAANSLRYAITDFPLNPVCTWCPFLRAPYLEPVSDLSPACRFATSGRLRKT